MDKEELRNHIMSSLEEDIQTGDITAQLVDSTKEIVGHIVLKEDAVICGVECVVDTMHILSTVYKKQMPTIITHYKDGDFVKNGSIIITLKGNARIILTGERTALNYLQTLSGISTTTKEYVDIIHENDNSEQSKSKVKLLDTRKTIPSMRLMSKYAVKCGGGYNHRNGLYDAFLIKENHLMSCNGITHAVELAHKLDPTKFIEVEVETLEELDEALLTQANRIMLDNFDNDTIYKAIERRDEFVISNNAARVEFEVSGNVTKNRLRELRSMDIDYVSTGALTKNISSIDFSMRFEI
jgi:nicotinate-nucleotide pyrophosphorylase (carboxylating)